jgi:hypothetical protein
LCPVPVAVSVPSGLNTFFVTEPASDVKVSADLIPLSALALDLDAPAEGWPVFLADRHLEIVLDDLGRSAISRDAARRLFDERRENEVRARELAERQEREAVARDQEWRARLPRGVPWYEVPDGVLPVVAMTAADRAAQPKRATVLQEALSGESMTFHRFGTAENES